MVNRSFDDIIKFIKNNATTPIVYDEEKKEEKKDEKDKTEEL